MNIDGKTIWQQAAGDTDRHYVELCYRWGVILNGPGYAGPWPGCEHKLRADGTSARKITDLRRFVSEMRSGDLVVLRVGTSQVFAVGQVVGEYQWNDDFGDVDGWDLQHVRRVRWLWASLASPKLFEVYSLNQGDTTQQLRDGVVTEWLKTLDIADLDLECPLPSFPDSESAGEITLDEVSGYLFDRGVASTSITKLLEEVGELTRIAKWYLRTTPPSEHETVAYLVVPLLRVLGWTPQRMAVEWNRVDVALFKNLPRGDTTLQVVVEAKKMGNSCLSARSQAMAYAIGRLGCSRLIVTDGLRYGIYLRDKDDDFHLYAYLNLARLHRHYSILECHGAEEALLSMAPEWKDGAP